MKHSWQRTFAEFAGPGIHHPSDTMRVTDEDAAVILAGLDSVAWSAPVHLGSGMHGGYTVRHNPPRDITALFHHDHLVGFYAGSYLWIEHDHRGRGLSTPLILAAAEVRAGCVMPAGVAVQGFTPVGLAAHRAAHQHAVVSAVAAGLPVPAAVLAEVRATTPEIRMPARAEGAPGASERQTVNCTVRAGD